MVVTTSSMSDLSATVFTLNEPIATKWRILRGTFFDVFVQGKPPHPRARNFVTKKLESLGSPWWRFCDFNLHLFDTDQECDGQTDGQTDGRSDHGYDARSILLSRVKNAEKEIGKGKDTRKEIWEEHAAIVQKGMGASNGSIKAAESLPLATVGSRKDRVMPSLVDLLHFHHFVLTYVVI